jgi:hypothetical protein
MGRNLIPVRTVFLIEFDQKQVFIVGELGFSYNWSFDQFLISDLEEVGSAFLSSSLELSGDFLPVALELRRDFQKKFIIFVSPNFTFDKSRFNFSDGISGLLVSSFLGSRGLIEIEIRIERVRNVLRVMDNLVNVVLLETWFICD